MVNGEQVIMIGNMRFPSNIYGGSENLSIAEYIQQYKDPYKNPCYFLKVVMPYLMEIG